MIPVSDVIIGYSKALAFICVMSLVTMPFLSLPLLHPILAVMGLIASPFFYFMGKAAK